MRIFVTGGTGFVGSHFLVTALSAGHEVIALRRRGSQPRFPLPHTPNWREGKLTDNWIEELKLCDVLVHLAAYGVSTGSDDWDGCFQTNVIDSLCLWRQGVTAGVQRYVILGSCFEYGKAGEQYDFIPVDAPLIPTTSYSASKAAATMAAIGLGVEHNTETIIARPFHVYGEGEDPSRFWPTLRNTAQSGGNMRMTLGEQVRDFTHVSILSAKILKIANPLFHKIQKGVPEIINIGTGKPQSLRDFAEQQWAEFQAHGNLLTGALEYRRNEVMRYVPEVDKT